MRYLLHLYNNRADLTHAKINPFRLRENKAESYSLYTIILGHKGVLISSKHFQYKGFDRSHMGKKDPPNTPFSLSNHSIDL